MTNAADDPRVWLAYADDDLRLARLAAAAVPALTIGACFHAQECAEKSLKAYLLQQSVAFPRTHNLNLLVGLCRKHDPDFARIADDCDILNGFGPPVRYPPTGFDPPTEPHVRAALAAAQRVADFVRDRLKLV